jgi:hypothetical protein
MVRSSKSVAGDRFEERIDVDEASLDVAARGLLAVRLDRHGRVTALAAGELRRFRGGGLSIDLESPTDVALWRAADGSWHGVVQDLGGPLPPSLRRLHARWTHLRTPPTAT